MVPFKEPVKKKKKKKRKKKKGFFFSGLGSRSNFSMGIF